MTCEPGQGDGLGAAGGAHRHVGAEHEGRDRAHSLGVDQGDAAANADGAGRRGDGDRIGLADAAADQTEHALAGADRQVTGLAIGIVDEPVDGQLGIRSDRERRTIEEHQMGAVVGTRGDQLVGLHVDADAQYALVGAGGLPRGSPSVAEVTPTRASAVPTANSVTDVVPSSAARRRERPEAVSLVMVISLGSPPGASLRRR